MPAAKRKIDDERPELPRQAQVGDRIRLKPELISRYAAACKQAGYDCDLYAIRTVIREDKFAPGGGRRLFVDGAPHCFGSSEVMLAWNTEDERREELRRRGWTV